MEFKPFSRHEGIVAPMMRNDLEVEFISSPLNSQMSLHTLPESEIITHLHRKTAGRSRPRDVIAHAFAAEKFLQDGSENPEFMLNQEPYRDASILLMGENFGVGSMQLMASIQLLQCGIKVVIASSFGPTFYEDSIAVGLLPIIARAELLKRLQKAIDQSPGSTISIDLERMQIEQRDIGTLAFTLDDSVRSLFLNGSTTLELLSEYERRTEKVKADRKILRPWLQ